MPWYDQLAIYLLNGFGYGLLLGGILAMIAVCIFALNLRKIERDQLIILIIVYLFSGLISCIGMNILFPV